MLILPTNPSGFSIFCDDVRYELSGKQLLLGVYDNVMMIAATSPTIIPQLCVLTTMRFDDEMLPKRATLKIIFEDESFVEQEIASMETELPVEVPQEGVDLLFSDKDGARSPQIKSEARIANLILSSNGRIKVRLHVHDNVYALGSLRVIFQPQEGISEPEAVPSN
jgi:hypothetical protein